jgi:hypothetical protein
MPASLLTELRADRLPTVRAGIGIARGRPHRLLELCDLEAAGAGQRGCDAQA